MSKDKNTEEIIENPAIQEDIAIAQHELIESIRSLSKTISGEPNSDSFLEATREIAFEAFEKKHSKKIAEVKKYIQKTAANGGIVYSIADVTILRYFCSKYGFKSSGTFLIL